MIHVQNNNEVHGDFITKVDGLINNRILPYMFTFGNVRRLDINNASIYLWQDAKGQVNYCFDLLDKECFTTSAAKLGNVLSSHFQTRIEVVNNPKEHLKRITSATIGVSKAVSDLERHDSFSTYAERFKPHNQNIDDTNLLVSSIQEESSVQSDVDLLSILDESTPQIQPLSQQKHPMHDQKLLYQGVIQLQTYYLESNMQTLFIYITELSISHKEVFRPDVKLAFFLERGLN